MTVIARQEIPRLILAIAICQLAGALGSVFTWYPTLIKPSFAPPGLFLAHLQECCMALGALPSLGELCSVSQLHYLAAEFIETFYSQPIQISGSLIKCYIRNL